MGSGRVRCWMGGLGVLLMMAGTLTQGEVVAAEGSARPLVVGYFGQWGVYDNFFPKNLVVSGAAAALDQVNYAQGFVTGGRCSVADPHADVDLAFTAEGSVSGRADEPGAGMRGDYHQMAELKRRFSGIKVLISLEGKGADFAADAQPGVREAFVRSCVDLFLRGRLHGDVADPGMVGLFDGIDLDWEFPHAEDAENFQALLAEFRRQMDELGAERGTSLRLAAAMGPSPRMYPGVDLRAVATTVDQMGVMNYDYNGPWNAKTGFMAPLYGDVGGTVERSILAYREAGVPAGKLLLGMPFYGYGWKEVAGAEGHGLLVQGRSIHGDRPYSYLSTLVPDGPEVAAGVPVVAAAAAGEKLPAASLARAETAVKVEARAVPGVDVAAKVPAPFVLYRDPRSKAPWLYDGDTFWTYDDPVSIRAKAAFVLEQGLGGVMAWELGEDTADAALLRAARAGLEAPVRVDAGKAEPAGTAGSHFGSGGGKF